MIYEEYVANRIFLSDSYSKWWIICIYNASNDLPKTMSYEGVELSLNGQGTHTMMLSMKIYENGLYLGLVNKDAKKLSTKIPRWVFVWK